MLLLIIPCTAYTAYAATHNATVNTTQNKTNTTAILDNIGQKEAQFQDVQGVSDANSMVQLGYGDCWADSEWLYDQLNPAGVPARIMGYNNDGSGIGYRHAWVEINTGNGWQSYDYGKYNSQHEGDLGTDTPIVLINASNTSADILSTGY